MQAPEKDIAILRRCWRNGYIEAVKACVISQQLSGGVAVTTIISRTKFVKGFGMSWPQQRHVHRREPENAQRTLRIN